MSAAVKSKPSALAKAQGIYGMLLPDWVATLARTIDEAGAIKIVAERVGYSPSTLSGIVNDSYTGHTEHVERAVRRTLMRDRVECPVLGPITGEACDTHQRRKSVPSTNPQAARLFRRCHSGTCPFSVAAEEAAS